MNPRLPRRALVVALPALAIATNALAQAGDPAAPIRALNEALLQIMNAGTKTPVAERTRMAAPAIQAAFDLPQILKTSVGARWSSLPAAQQTELLAVFSRYTVASYVANFDSFGGQKFVILPTTRAVGADQVVETQIVTSDGDSTRIDYEMRLSGGKWKAIDVLLDGSISRVAVQRSDFRALLADGDANKLIASLRAKTAALESGGNI